MTPFTQRGGIRVGPAFWLSWGATFPFAKITVTQEGIQISVFSLFFIRRYSFARSDIRRLDTEHGVFFRGLVIEHTRDDYSSFMLFWSLAWSELVTALQQRGFRVYDSQ